MNTIREERALTEEQREYLEAIKELPKEEQAKAASFAAGLMAASKEMNRPA